VKVATTFEALAALLVLANVAHAQSCDPEALPAHVSANLLVYPCSIERVQGLSLDSNTAPGRYSQFPPATPQVPYSTTVWFLEPDLNEKLSKRDVLRSRKTQLEFVCASKRVVTKFVAGYSKRNGGGELLRSASMFSPVGDPVIPGTLGENLHRYFCVATQPTKVPSNDMQKWFQQLDEPFKVR
jgi:hypothetical protein